MQDRVDDARSVASRIAEILSSRIVTGALKPGEPVRQDHVALEFRASHVPVREAFRVLEGQGLLVSEPRRGVRVARLDPEIVHEVTQIRAALECLALRHAMPRITAEALAQAERALREGEGSSDISVWESANRRFHRALYEPCGMQRLLAQLDDLHRTSARFLFAAWQGLGWQPRSEHEHRAILACVRVGDTENAVQLLNAHIIAAGAALVENLIAAANSGQGEAAKQ
jgi:DNA-binding GntR family transcriptional regulator